MAELDLKAGGGDDRGRDGWMASLTQWTWVWANSGRWWRTGKPGMLQPMRSPGARHDLPIEHFLKHHFYSNDHSDQKPPFCWIQWLFLSPDLHWLLGFIEYSWWNALWNASLWLLPWWCILAPFPLLFSSRTSSWGPGGFWNIPIISSFHSHL